MPLPSKYLMAVYYTMSRKRSKRKQPEREEFVLHEHEKIEEGVFDKRTMLRLRRLFTHDIISSLGFVIATGKEADVYLADPGSKISADAVVVKIFRIETSGFARRMLYITGDPRFGKIKGGMNNVVNEWCKKEYGNLKIAALAGVHAPKPYYFNGNILAMEFIDNNGVPASTLKDTELSNPTEILSVIISAIKKLYAKGLVHSDVSEYNILLRGGTPYLIDFGQAVVLGHPEASYFLQRDVENIIAYFEKKYGISRNIGETLAYITG